MTPDAQAGDTGGDVDGEATAADITVRGGNPSPAEAAAVVAVVATALEEIRSEGVPVRASRPDAWALSARGLRQPLARGGWRSFTGVR